MVELTQSVHVNRMIALLMMLPSPEDEEYAHFWDGVAEEHHVSRGYVTQKVSVHLKLLLERRDSRAHHGQELAEYALFFFGQASEDLTRSITNEISLGAPNTSAGQMWVRELRTAAFAVIEEAFPDDRLLDRVQDWVRRFHSKE